MSASSTPNSQMEEMEPTLDKKFTLSVVIPTCDREDMLSESLACVLSQSILPDEIIVVNNGVKGLTTTNFPDRVRVVDIMPYAGASQARNFGAVMASGEYIAFLDDDDLWEMEYVQKAVNLIIQQQFPDCVLTRLDKLVGGSIFLFKDAGQYDDLFCELFTHNPGVIGSNIVVRRQVFMAVGGFDCKMIAAEDVSFLLELFLKQYRIVPASHIQAIMRDHGGERLSDQRYILERRLVFFRKYQQLMNCYQRYLSKYKIYIAQYQHNKGALWWFLLAVAYKLLAKLCGLTLGTCGEISYARS